MGLDDLTADDLAGADAAVVRALRPGKPPSEVKPSGQPFGRSIVYSCSMPNQGSCLAYFLAALAHAARVLVGCGDMSFSSTSHITRTLLPPRIGSGQVKTGRSTQSDLSPVACSVEEPSNPQMPGSAPSAMILVFERRPGVGWAPSIQMYSAWYGTVSSRGSGWRRNG